MFRLVTLLSLLIICIFLTLRSSSQSFSNTSEFLLVEPDHALDCSSCANIRDNIKQDLIESKFFNDMVYSANVETIDFNSDRYDNINYLLSCRIKKVSGSNDYKLTFTLKTLNQVSADRRPITKITWNNNEYIIGPDYKSDNSINEILKLVLIDLEKYKRHKKLKVRVKVDEFKEPVENIDKEEFSKWLTQILNKHESISKSWVFYYNDKKYPDELKEKFYGSFKDAKPKDDDILKVNITTFINDDEKYCKVTINSDEYKTDFEYQKKVTAAIDKILIEILQNDF